MRYTPRDKPIEVQWSSIPISGLLASAALGAGVMYALDPDRGARRRALARDRVVHMSSVSRKAGRSTARDVGNRTKGLLHEVTRLFRDKRVPPDILVARVWSHIGGFVSHPGALNITASEEGTITLAGPALTDEIEQLIQECSRVPGVTRVENRLEPHQQSDRVPALQGGAVRRSPFRQGQHYWSPTTRLLAGSMGALLFGYGARDRRPVGMVALIGGGAVLLRSLSNMELLRFFGLTPTRRVVDVHKTFEIEQPIEEVFSFWSDFDQLAQALEHVYQVRDFGQGRQQWRWRVPPASR